MSFGFGASFPRGNAYSLVSAIQSLFSDGQQGYWYAASDLLTLYADNAGTTPVSMPGQGSAVTVGLQLDKRLGLVLGSELCTDPGLNNPSAWTTSGATPTWVVSGGKAAVTQTAAGNRWLVNGTPLTVGKTYLVTADVVVTAGSCVPDMSSYAAGDATTSGSKQWIITASTPTLQFMARPTFIGEIDNISVRELPGNHRFQATSTSRPALSARYNLLTGTDALATQSVTTAAADYKIRFEGAGSITLSGTATGT